MVLAFALTMTACSTGNPCDDSDPSCAGETELITEVIVTLTNTADASDTVTITASDPDGDGAGITFSPASVALTAGATYAGSIELNDTISGESITEEIEEEAEEHLFRYSFDPSSAGTIALTDVESDYTTETANAGDFAVGLDFEVSVAAGATGTADLVALLYHFDEGPKTSSTATSDEIDVDIDFPVTFN